MPPSDCSGGGIFMRGSGRECSERVVGVHGGEPAVLIEEDEPELPVPRGELGGLVSGAEPPAAPVASQRWLRGDECVTNEPAERQPVGWVPGTADAFPDAVGPVSGSRRPAALA